MQDRQLTVEQMKQERELNRAKTDLEIMKIQDQMMVDSMRSQQATTNLFLQMKENYMRALLDPNMPEEKRKSLLDALKAFEKQ
jgi:hypothetical protein